jgi:hypothetical protein
LKPTDMTRNLSGILRKIMKYDVTRSGDLRDNVNRMLPGGASLRPATERQRFYAGLGRNDSVTAANGSVRFVNSSWMWQSESFGGGNVPAPQFFVDRHQVEIVAGLYS